LLCSQGIATGVLFTVLFDEGDNQVAGALEVVQVDPLVSGVDLALPGAAVVRA
tara:strand:+ start:274 stop:432 length:159 start_codon:yes stop_codon:yes gene_type:complete